MTSVSIKASMLALSALTLAFAGPAQATDEPKVVESGYHTGYIPAGFDSNDIAQVVGEGLFSDTCYRPATPMVVVDPVAREIRVASYAYKYSGVCLQVLVPYSQTLELGIVPAGTYRVYQDPRGTAYDLGTLQVGVATSSDADDFLYAPVSQAYAETKNGKTTIRVTGSFTDSCMKLVDVMVKPQPRVLVVQPIAEKEERADCAAGNFPFDRSVEVAGVRRGRYLLHVRSLNGKAFNHLVDLN